MATEADQAFAKIAVHNKLVLESEAAEAMEIVEDLFDMGLPTRLSQVLLDKGHIKPEAVESIDRLLLKKNLELPPASEIELLEIRHDEDRKVAQLVFKNRILSKDQVQEAIQIQQQVHALGVKKRLGEILVDKGWVDERTVGALVSMHRHIEDAELSRSQRRPVMIGKTTARFFKEHVSLGKIAVDNGYITSEDLNDGLALQTKIDEKAGVRYPLGGLLVDMGRLADEQLQLCRKIQGQQMKVTQEPLPIQLSPDNETRLGVLMQANQLVPQEQIEEALGIQEKLGGFGIEKKIGEILVMKGYLDVDSLTTMLAVQEESRRMKRRRLVKEHQPMPTQKKVVIGSCIAGAILVVGLLGFLLSRPPEKVVDPAAEPYQVLMAKVTELNTANKPHEALVLIDAFVKRYPQSKLSKEADTILRANTQGVVSVVDNAGGPEFFASLDKLAALRKADPVKYDEVLSFMAQMRKKFTKPVPQQNLRDLTREVQSQMRGDAVKVAKRIRTEAEALVAAGKLREAQEKVKSFPEYFIDTASYTWLQEYRRTIEDKMVDSKDAEARDAYWALARRIEVLRKGRKFDEAMALCKTYPPRYASTHYSKQLEDLKAEIETQKAEHEAEQTRLAAAKAKTEAKARVAAVRSQIPSLVAQLQYTKALKLIDGAMGSVTDDGLRAGLVEDKALVQQLAKLFTEIRGAFKGGLAVKLLLAPGKAGSLVAMTDEGFRVETKDGDEDLPFTKLRADHWVKVLYKTGTATKQPIAAARFLYRVRGVLAADRLLGEAIKRDASLRPQVHELLVKQGYELPKGAFVYHEGRWITQEELDHAKKGQVRVGDKWWTRDKIGEFMSGKHVKDAAAEDPNSFKNLEQRKAAQWARMGVNAVRTIANHGPTNRRVDIAIVSSGFTKTGLGNFRSMCKQITDSLGRLDPWGYYFNYINVHAVEVIDKHKATAIGDNLDQMRVPVLGFAGQGYYSIWRANPTTAWQYARLAPGADFVIVVANITQGSATGSITSKVATVHRAGSVRWDPDRGPYAGNFGEPGGDVATALAHVLGHSIGRLADEYEYGAASSIAGFQEASDSDYMRNVTRASDVKRSPWHYWLKKVGRAAPGSVRCWEGANNSPNGWYRAQSNCIMRDSSNRYCVVCREQIERTLLKYIRLVESAWPGPLGTQVWKDGEQTFKIRPIQPVNHEKEMRGDFVVEWFLNGKMLGNNAAEYKRKEATFALKLKGQDMAPGEYELVARVIHRTPYVRRDFGRTTDCVAWRFRVLGHRKPKLTVPKEVNVLNREFIRFGVSAELVPEGWDVYAEGLPDGATFDPSTRVFSWRPRPSQTGLFVVKIGVGNGDHSVVREVPIVVRGGGHNYRPIPEYIPSMEVDAGTQVNINLSAIDINRDTIRYGFAEPPDPALGVKLDPRTGQLSWDIPHYMQGKVTIHWQATDGRSVGSGKVLIMVNQGRVTPATRFPGHELGLGLWYETGNIRLANMDRMGTQPLGWQVLTLTRMMRDVNATLRKRAALALHRLLIGATGKEAEMLCALFVHAEGEMYEQHCITPEIWPDVRKAFKIVVEKDGLPAALKDAATEIDKKISSFRNKHY